ncbi:hypothetical protein ASD07_15045 [Duganella sp. Root336D2]|nr:hypothetical protein ASD07_15045 [Duganella sp. Root336D2]
MLRKSCLMGFHKLIAEYFSRMFLPFQDLRHLITTRQYRELTLRLLLLQIMINYMRNNVVL